jgi:gliding motility-associated-like protein
MDQIKSYLTTKTTKLCRLLFSFIFFYLIVYQADGIAQLDLQVNNSANELVKKIVGPGYKVSNAKLVGSNGSVGTFNYLGTDIGLNHGIILSTGLIEIAKGPNNLQSAGFNHGASGDLDLSILSNDSATFDGVSLEFDLVPACNSLSIEFVFASEEYNEYVGEEFNDVFAFFISGPGITGYKNIALVPGTNLPITINNVNANLNASYFVDNVNGSGIQYDGFTTPILAKENVIPCETYHLKIVIADCMDGIFDSAIFIKGETIQCFPTIYLDEASNTDAITTCSNGNFTFCRVGPQTDPFVVRYKIAGSAENGKHYQQIADSVIIPAGEACTSLTVKPIPVEGVEEKLSLMIVYQFGPCIIYDTLILYIVPPPKIDAGPDIEICSGDSIKIGSISLPGNIYSWSPSVGLSNSNSSETYLKLTNDGVSDLAIKYELWATNPLIGNCVLKDSIKVKVKSLPKADFATELAYCTRKKINFSDNSSVGPGKNIVQWYWDFGDNSFSTTKNPSITPSEWGIYNISLTVTDNTGCQDDFKIPINIWPSPVVDFTANVPCAGAAVSFNNNSTIESGLIEKMVWNFGDGSPLLSEISPNHVFPTSANAYNVSLIATSDKNCVSNLQKTIYLKPNPEVNFSMSGSNVCLGDSVIFYNASNGMKEIWSFGDGVTAEIKNPRHAYSQPGVYNVRLLSYSSFGCADSLVRTINVSNYPVFNFSALDSSGCAEFCTTFFSEDVSGNNTVSTWKWLFDAQTLTGSSVNYCFDKAGDYPVALIASNAGCTDTLIKPSFIHVEPKPTAEFILDQKVTSILDSVVVYTDASSTDVNTWYWDFGDNKTSNLKNPSPHPYPFAKGEYLVTLIVSTGAGCKDTINKYVFLNPESFAYVANTFSPNDDGINDIFRPYFTGAFKTARQQMQIFDRWGARIFYTDNLEQGWDGRISGSLIYKQDVYLYKITFISKEDNSLLKEMSGYVLLIK